MSMRLQGEPTICKGGNDGVEMMVWKGLQRASASRVPGSRTNNAPQFLQRDPVR